MVEILMERVADINAEDQHGETALCKAARLSHHGIIRFLAARGADVNLVSSKSGRTPLVETCYNGDAGVARILLEEYGADVAKVGPKGRSPLMVRDYHHCHHHHRHHHQHQLHHHHHHHHYRL
jgi:ankyrin repeat protein